MRTYAPTGTKAANREIWRADKVSVGTRILPEETAVALIYNGGTYAVMMATPLHLEDFAVGFTLNEGVVNTSEEIEPIEFVELGDGIEARFWISGKRATWLAARRRLMIGTKGCGLCEMESLTEALKSVPIVGTHLSVSYDEIVSAMQRMSSLQNLNQQTRAVHVAAFWTCEAGIVFLSEDVGRHDALD